MINIFYCIVFAGYDTVILTKNVYEAVSRNEIQLNWRETVFIRLILVDANYALLLFMGYVLSRFLSFHFELVFENKTTIECIAHNNLPFESSFTFGQRRNFEQVFGTSKFLMWLPISFGRGKPSGDGIVWGNDDFSEPKY